MDHSTISALVFAERAAENRNPHDESRRVTLAALDRKDAARRRALRMLRLREAAARALRRVATFIEPARAECPALIPERG